MDYHEQIQHLYEDDPGFSVAVETLKKLEKRKARVLNFSHHDLDGVTSAFILKRILEKHLKASVVTKLPAHFRLWEETLVETLKKEGRFDLLIISDKGTFAAYDALLKHVKDILIIDHHQLDGKPEKCKLFNPTVEISEYSSSVALLCHMIGEKMGVNDIYMDFAALIGCRGDFAFDPVEKTSLEFTRPFLEHVQKKFPEMFNVFAGRPTMYDLVDRNRTAPINQLAEALHVGTISHLYSDLLKVDIENGPEFLLKFFEELAESGSFEITSVESLLRKGKFGPILMQVFDQYKKDWKLLEGRIQTPIALGEARGVGIYLFFAEEAEAMKVAPFPAILPFVVSTNLENLKRAGRHAHAMAIIFCPKERGIHISMRGGGGLLNCGKICYELANKLSSIYPGYSIGGGGHEKAAELTADKPVPMYAVMQELLFMFQRIIELSKLLDNGRASRREIEEARNLGISC
ncbi:MAG: DHH family phosphoesterase [Candidatus Hadarchaeales archaeon]